MRSVNLPRFFNQIHLLKLVSGIGCTGQNAFQNPQRVFWQRAAGYCRKLALWAGEQMFHCRVRQPSLDQSRGGKGVDATLFLNALKVFANNLLPVLPAQFLMQTMSKPSTRVMRNSEPQTGDVKIGLLSCFYHFFSLWNFPHYHLLFIDFLSFVDWLFKRGRSVDFAFCLCTIVDEYTWRERKIDINYEFCFYYSSLIQRCSLFYIILDCVI